MDRVYIKTKELDIYDYLRIEGIKEELGINLTDIISVEDLLRILEGIYSEYFRLKEKYDDMLDNIYGKEE